MIEKYLKVLQGSEVEKNLKAYEESQSMWCEVANKFAADFGIEAKEFYVCRELGVHNLTENDKQKYGSQLKKDGIWFKKSSALYKEYAKRCVEAGLDKAKLRLIIWDYNIHAVYGKHSISRFKFEDTWYVKVTTENDYTVPKDFEQIRASEYHKLWEELHQ